MKTFTKADCTEEICGIGVTKDQIFQGTKPFSMYGVFPDILMSLKPKDIQELSSLGATGIDSFLKNKSNPWASFAEYLSAEVLNVGLAGIKKWANNREINMACEYVLKRISLCENDIDQEYNFMASSYIESIISGLPISKDKANNIYRLPQTKMKEANKFPKIKFTDTAYKAIGYLVFCLFQSRKADIALSQSVRKLYDDIGIDKEDIKQYQNDYNVEQEDNMCVIRGMRQIFGNAKLEKFDINPQYVKNVIRKLNSAYPESGSKVGRNILDGADMLTDFYFEKNKFNAGLNLLSGVLRMVLDGSEGDEDNIIEEYISGMRETYGYDVTKQDSEIIKGAKDYRDVILS